MESWDSQSSPAPSPNIKFENSPAESFLSNPGDMYPPLFAPSTATTLNPLEIMTPQSFDDKQPELSALEALSPTVRDASSPPSPAAGEKKPAKKRKSWGQVLPEPKTNLPPRKRAKTDDEKEQRRVERVLRNRRAAQSSRERKRLEVEALERRNNELENMLRQVQQTNLALVEQLHKFQRTSGVVPRAPQQFDALRSSPVTFSQVLFGSQDGHNVPFSNEGNGSLQDLIMSSQTDTTVNPASLSPELTPVPDDEMVSATKAAKPVDATAIPEQTSPDATQHPAAVLCQDLQCPSVEGPLSWLAASQQQLLHPALALFLPLQLLLVSTSAILTACQRPLMQIAMSLKAGFSLPPTPSILNTIIWLVTTPQPSLSQLWATRTSTSSTSTSTSTKNSTSSLPTSSSSCSSSKPTTAQSQTRRSSTLRLKSLRKILSSSPTLARPLMDATMAVLRLASSESHAVDRVRGGDESAVVAAGGMPLQQQQQPDRRRTTWLDGVPLPSKEVLLTLVWALQVEERRMQIRDQIAVSKKEPGRPSVSDTWTPNQSQKYVLKVVGKRGWEADEQFSYDVVRAKRCFR